MQVTYCLVSTSECTKKSFGGRNPAGPAALAYSAPADPLAGFKAEWKGRERTKGVEMRETGWERGKETKQEWGKGEIREQGTEKDGGMESKRGKGRGGICFIAVAEGWTALCKCGAGPPAQFRT